MAITSTNRVKMLCDACGDDREFAPQTKPRKVSVRGEDISVLEPVLVCPVCGETQPDLRDGIDSLRLAYDEYRRRHNLLTPERIHAIREQFGLSREAFAAVLGMSPATLYRYEDGALQDDLHDTLIGACDNPATMARLVHRRRQHLSDLQYQRFTDAMACLGTPNAVADMAR